MVKLPELYVEYRKSNEEFQRRRRELFKQPEMDAHELAVDLNIYEFRRRLETIITRHLSRARKLYDIIYNGEPTERDLEKFLEVAKPLQDYKDFLTAEQLDVLKVSCSIVEAYKATKVQTKVDEHERWLDSEPRAKK